MKGNLFKPASIRTSDNFINSFEIYKAAKKQKRQVERYEVCKKISNRIGNES